MKKLPAEPIRFNPIFKEKVWGGQALASKLGKQLPDNKLIGESWEICGFGDEQSIVADGSLAGHNLGDLFGELKDELAGEIVSSESFPLLVKLIDSRDKLSVQVHPNDFQVKAHQWGEFGKTECWFIIDAAPDAGLVLGFKRDVTKTEIKEALEANALQELLKIVNIKPGDTYHIPAGTVHAILGHSLIYEVQQSSDITLRLFDWNRPRPLHVQDAIEVADTRAREYLIKPVALHGENIQHTYNIVCKYFSLEHYQFTGLSQVNLSPTKSFRILTCINGNVSINYPSGTRRLSLGESLLIPAILKDIQLSATAPTSILCTNVPDIQNEIINPLLNRDISRSSLLNLGGYTDVNDLLPFL